MPADAVLHGFVNATNNINDDFSDSPPGETCIPCMMQGFVEGFKETFLQSAVIGLGVGLGLAFLAAAGVAVAPIVLAGAIVGGAVLLFKAGQIWHDWDNLSSHERGRRIGQLAGTVTGGAAGGAVGGAMGTGAAQLGTDLGSGLSGPMMATAGGGPVVSGGVAATGVTAVPAGQAAVAGAGVSMAMSGNSGGGSSGGGGGGGKKPSSPNRLNDDINKGKAPKSVERADSPRVPFEKPHVHFDDGSALNSDGTWKHGGRPLSNSESSWLKSHGWLTPKE